VKPTPDLYGLALLEALSGEATAPLHLRAADGRLTLLAMGGALLEPAFMPFERDLLALAKGRVLDLGAGSGRAALRLQDRGGDVSVVAVDVSPGACECMRRRGVANVVETSWQALAGSPTPGEPMDSVLMLGAGLGMAASPAGLGLLLSALRSWLRQGGAALLTATAPPPGVRASTSRMRVESGFRVGEWFDWLCLDPSYLRRAAAAAGLAPLESGASSVEPGAEYAAVLVKR
jgi:SAM-dependent methyltransferase